MAVSWALFLRRLNREEKAVKEFEGKEMDATGVAGAFGIERMGVEALLS